MDKQSWKILGVAVAVVMAFCPLCTATQPSAATLADMGLGGLTVISDNDALSIRGQGYKGPSSSVRVFGNSFATINTKKGGAHSENGYVNNGKHFAAGGNNSYAGVVKKSGGGYGHKGKSSYKSVKVFAGGSSWGIAF